MSYPFIVFEGVDGAGKSEVSKRVAEKIDAVHLESPIEPFRGIRRYVDEYLCEKGRFLFYLASNLDLSRSICETRTSKKIVCARYFYSTIIGYASRNGLHVEDVCRNLPVGSSDFEKPDITIFLYVSEDIQRIRIGSREHSLNSKLDFRSLNDSSYQKALYQNYIDVANSEGWIFIDTSQMDIDEVVRQSVSFIDKK